MGPDASILSSRELICEAVPDIDRIRGSVSLPAVFGDENISRSRGLAESVLCSIEVIREKKEVIPSYLGRKAGLSGRIFGFFVNYSVRQQNKLNAEYLAVADELARLAEERRNLELQLDCLRSKLERIKGKTMCDSGDAT